MFLLAIFPRRCFLSNILSTHFWSLNEMVIFICRCESLNNIVRHCLKWRALPMPEVAKKLAAYMNGQMETIKKALYDQGRYQLTEELMRISVSPEAWEQMSDKDRSRKFRQLACGPKRGKPSTVMSTCGRLEVKNKTTVEKKPHQKTSGRGTRTASVSKSSRGSRKQNSPELPDTGRSDNDDGSGDRKKSALSMAILNVLQPKSKLARKKCSKESLSEAKKAKRALAPSGRRNDRGYKGPPTPDAFSDLDVKLQSSKLSKTVSSGSSMDSFALKRRPKLLRSNRPSAAFLSSDVSGGSDSNSIDSSPTGIKGNLIILFTSAIANWMGYFYY